MSQYAHPESLVSTSWVADNLNKSTICLVEVDVDTSAYKTGHICGAIGWNWTTQLQDTLSRDIISKPQMEDLLGSSGISNDTTVVLYGDNNNWFAAWAFWQMKIYGHDAVKLMNGGRATWESEKRSFTQEIPKVSQVSYTASEPDESIRAYREEVLKAVNMGNTSFLDVRSPSEFSGDVIAPENILQEGAQRSGHIPNAVNIPWAMTVSSDGTFKPFQELMEIYAEAGITEASSTITYCRIGERSSHSWFVLTQLLGLKKVRNYDGSWTEYGSIVRAKIQR